MDDRQLSEAVASLQVKVAQLAFAIQSVDGPAIEPMALTN